MALARSLASIAAYGLLTGLILLSFLLLLLGPIRAQRTVGLEVYWGPEFPCWDRPWLVPWWSLKATVGILDYCFRPLGGLLLLLALLGGWLWWTQGQRSWLPGFRRADRPDFTRGYLLLLVGPLGLGWLAGLLHAYPYAGTRVMVFALPALALLIGTAIPPTWSWSAQRLPRLTPPAALVLLLAPAGLCLYRVARPWDRPDWDRVIGYVASRYQHADTLAGNTWEADYYFRHQPDVYRNIRLDPMLIGKRVWVVLVGATEEERRRTLVPLLGPQTELQEQQNFDHVSVYCLGPAKSPSG